MYDSIAPRQQVWIRQTAAGRVFRRIVEAVGPGLVLPVKGVVTGRTLYDDLADRPISDLDLRLGSPADLPRLVAFAREHGRIRRPAETIYGSVVLDVDGLAVDVECSVGPPGLSGLTVRDMLARSDSGEALFGFPCAVPELHDHALLLCINAFKDKLVLAPLWAVEDLMRVALAPRFEPTRLAELARVARSATLVWIVADWLAPRSEVWRQVREAIGPRPPRRVYARAFRVATSVAPWSVASRVLARAAADDPRMRVRALASAAALEWRRER